MCFEFGDEVMEPKKRFKWAMENTQNKAGRDFGYVLAVIYFEVPGRHKYDLSGNLTEFDPISEEATKCLASFCSGDRMSVIDERLDYTNEAIAAVGHAATKLRWRKNKLLKLGTRVVDLFIQEVKQLAEEFTEDYLLAVTEAEEDSKWFWNKCGFMWVENTPYRQAPLIWNPNIGENLFEEVPEWLMVRMHEEVDRIGKRTVLNTVRTLYYIWSLSDPASFNTDQAKQVASDYVFGQVLCDFQRALDALPEQTIMLVPPDGELL